ILIPATDDRHSLPRFSLPLVASVIVWLLFVEAGVHGWYRVHESRIANSRWGVRWPSAENGYKGVTIAPEAESLLRYNDGGGAASSYENERAANEEDWTARGRIRAAMRGQREIGAQMLEVVVWGYDDDVEASVALQRQLEQIVGVS